MNFPTSTNSHTVTGLTNDVTYSFQVRANNNIGPGTASEVVTATPIGPPAAPRDLTAKASDGQVNVYWANPNDTSITKWQYRYSSTNNSGGVAAWDPDWSDIAEISLLGSNNLRYEQAGLTNGTPYTFQIRAVNDGGAGPGSSTTMTPASGQTAPSGMINVEWTETTNRAYFTWNQGDDSINKYEFRFSDSSSQLSDTDSWSDATTLNSERVTSFDHYLGGSVTTRFYQFRPVNTGAEPDAPGPITAVTVINSITPGASAEPPSAPTGLSAAARLLGTAFGITLSWNDPNDTSITKYQMRESVRGADYGVWRDIADSGPKTITEVLFTPKFVGSNYVYQVRAVNSEGDGAPATSNVVFPGAPNPPTSLSGGIVLDNPITDIDESLRSLNFSWSDPAEVLGVTVTGYQYRIRLSPDANWEEWTDTDSFENQQYVTGLLPGATYHFQVKAMARNVASAPSVTITKTTTNPPLPNKPENLTATGIIGAARLGWDRVTRGDPAIEDDTVSVYRYQTTTSAQVTLSWDDPGNTAITKWEYRQSETEAGLDDASWQEIEGSDATTTSHQVTGLNVGGNYFFEVRPFTTTELPAVTITEETSADFTGATVWTAFSNDADAVEGTVRGLSAGDYYVRIRAANPAGDSPESDAALFTSTDPVNGTWTYQMVVDPGETAVGSEDGAEVSLVATWTASDNRSEIVTLSAIGAGTATAGVDATPPTAGRYQYRVGPADGGSWSHWTDIAGSTTATTQSTLSDLNLRIALFIEIRPFFEGIGAGKAISIPTADTVTLEWTASDLVDGYQYGHGIVGPLSKWVGIPGGGSANARVFTEIDLSRPTDWRIRSYRLEDPLDRESDKIDFKPVSFSTSVSLSWPAPNPPARQFVGFATSAGADLSAESPFPQPVGDTCTADTKSASITCIINLIGGSQALYADSGAFLRSHNVYGRTGFSLTAVVNGIATTTDVPANADIPAGQVEVVLNVAPDPPPPPTGGGSTGGGGGGGGGGQTEPPPTVPPTVPPTDPPPTEPPPDRAPARAIGDGVKSRRNNYDYGGETFAGLYA